MHLILDPHNGNLLKVRTKTKRRNRATLAYLDFGLLATIPTNVRDALVCAVAQLIFSKDVEAVASLFAELDLIEDEIIQNPTEKKALTDALTKTMEEVLVYPSSIHFSSCSSNTDVPMLKFDKLLDGLVRLIPRFKFQLPPYFINNARALGTLEGTARTINPNFNAFSIMYPYALNRILKNPSKSVVVDKTLQRMTTDDRGRIDRRKVVMLLNDSVRFSGFSRWKVLRDVLRTKGGRRIGREMVRQIVLRRGR